MFGFFKSKRRDPETIAATVLQIGFDEALLAECRQRFEFSEEDVVKARLAALSFAYCAATLWALQTGNAKIQEACEKAPKFIANLMLNPDRFVPVGNYIASSRELA